MLRFTALRCETQRFDFDVSVALRDQETQLLAARAGQEREWTEATAGRMSLAQELGRVKAELEMLRAELKQEEKVLAGGSLP